MSQTNGDRPVQDYPVTDWCCPYCHKRGMITATRDDPIVLFVQREHHKVSPNCGAIPAHVTRYNQVRVDLRSRVYLDPDKIEGYADEIEQSLDCDVDDILRDLRTAIAAQHSQSAYVQLLRAYAAPFLSSDDRSQVYEYAKRHIQNVPREEFNVHSRAEIRACNAVAEFRKLPKSEGTGYVCKLKFGYVFATHLSEWSGRTSVQAQRAMYGACAIHKAAAKHTYHVSYAKRVEHYVTGWLRLGSENLRQQLLREKSER